MSDYLTKYFNAPTFSEATTVYDDDLLSTVSADGYYSDEVVTRYQLSGVLGINETCPTCVSYPCTDAVGINTLLPARFDLKTTFGSDIGAIKLTVPNVQSFPIGIQLIKDNIKFDVKFSSTNSLSIGQINAPITNELSLFSSGATAPCSSYNFSSISLPTYTYNGTIWVTDNVLSTVSLTNKRTATTEETLNDLILYVPKTSAADFTLRTIAVFPCGGQSAPITIGCPVSLPSFAISNVESTLADACANNDYENTFYVGYVLGATVGGDVRINLNDFIFNDSNGGIKPPNGYYGINGYNKVGGIINPSFPYAFIKVEDGIVIEVGSCT